MRVSIRTPAGRLRFDRCTLRIPYFGKLLKKVALARFARTLSTLLLGGIPLLQSLDIVKNVVEQHGAAATPSRTAATASARARASPTRSRRAGSSRRCSCT